MFRIALIDKVVEFEDFLLLADNLLLQQLLHKRLAESPKHAHHTSSLRNACVNSSCSCTCALI